ncbi:hypothetical protein TYRP_007900 [Tyrophagus putrescentiae]|nr:hypothetical protein TYRP_007900 [Tyrophagus putrescentiae]
MFRGHRGASGACKPGIEDLPGGPMAPLSPFSPIFPVPVARLCLYTGWVDRVDQYHLKGVHRAWFTLNALGALFSPNGVTPAITFNSREPISSRKSRETLYGTARYTTKAPGTLESIKTSVAFFSNSAIKSAFTCFRKIISSGQPTSSRKSSIAFLASWARDAIHWLQEGLLTLGVQFENRPFLLGLQVRQEFRASLDPPVKNVYMKMHS